MAYTKEEYYLSIQNSHMQGTGDFIRKRHPLEGVDIRAIPMDHLELMIEVLAKEYDRRTMDTPLPSPTRRQLQNNEALKNAYEAMHIVLKLQGEMK